MVNFDRHATHDHTLAALFGMQNDNSIWIKEERIDNWLYEPPIRAPFHRPNSSWPGLGEYSSPSLRGFIPENTGKPVDACA